MTERSVRAALISLDDRLRQQVRDVLGDPDLGASLDLELSVPFASYGEEQVRALRQLNPDLVIIDLEDDPELGVRLAQFLTESGPGQRILGVGPMLSPELLLGVLRAGAVDYLPKPV